MEKTKETHKNKYNIVPEKKRKLWFKGLKSIMKMRYKRPAFVHLGEPFEYGSLILSNHEGTDAPMAFEIYHPHPIRMWGAYEMNSGLKKCMYTKQKFTITKRNTGTCILQDCFVCLQAHSPICFIVDLILFQPIKTQDS